MRRRILRVVLGSRWSPRRSGASLPLVVAGNDLSLGLEAGHFTLNPKSDPQSIDVEFTDCLPGINTPTSRYLGIYRLEGDTLTLCLKPDYRGRPERPTEFSPERAHLYIFKRAKE